MVGSLTVTSMDASPLAVEHSFRRFETARLNVFLGGWGKIREQKGQSPSCPQNISIQVDIWKRRALWFNLGLFLFRLSKVNNLNSTLLRKRQWSRVSLMVGSGKNMETLGELRDWNSFQKSIYGWLVLCWFTLWVSRLLICLNQYSKPPTATTIQPTVEIILLAVSDLDVYTMHQLQYL